MKVFKDGSFFILFGFFATTCFSVSALNHCDEGIPVYGCNYYSIIEVTTCKKNPESSKEIICMLSGFDLSIILSGEYHNNKEVIYESIAELCAKHDVCKQQFDCYVNLLYRICDY